MTTHIGHIILPAPTFVLLIQDSQSMYYIEQQTSSVQHTQAGYQYVLCFILHVCDPHNKLLPSCQIWIRQHGGRDVQRIGLRFQCVRHLDYCCHARIRISSIFEKAVISKLTWSTPINKHNSAKNHNDIENFNWLITNFMSGLNFRQKGKDSVTSRKQTLPLITLRTFYY